MDNEAGQQIGGGSFAASGSTFNASINFALPSQGGVVRATIGDAAEASATLDLFVAAAQQTITIDSPPPGTQVGSPVVITGRTVRYPYQGKLTYRVSDSGGNQLAFGAFDVAGTPGYGTTFSPSIVFNLPPQEGLVRFDFFDQNAQTGVVVASSTIDLRVSPPAPVQQVITIDSPPPWTQVGSPVVITGRTTRFPGQGVLGYRVYDAGNGQISAGTFAVNGSAGQPASFTASLSFTPPNGGTIRVDVFDQDAASGAIVGGTSVNLQVASLPQPQAAITGLLTTLDQSPLPSEPGTVITLRLEDRTRQDVPAVLIAETQVAPSTRIPLPFELRYNPAQINAANTYVVSADVRFNGVLLYRTNAQYTVITQGNPTNIVLLLERV